MRHLVNGKSECGIAQSDKMSFCTSLTLSPLSLISIKRIKSGKVLHIIIKEYRKFYKTVVFRIGKRKKNRLDEIAYLDIYF